MTLNYPIKFEPDDNGTLVTCPALPEVTTFGEDEADAIEHARDAIEEAIAARIARAAAGMLRENFSVLLSHTPEVYREAERSGFDVMLSGHTHGGQICLPGGIPITLDAKLPRHMGKGAWRYGKLRGYTSVGAGSSVVPVRFNCPPEITLHHFEASA